MCVRVAHRCLEAPCVRAQAQNRNTIRAVVGIHATIETCFEVDAELVEHTLAPAAGDLGVSPRDRAMALLERMADVARPRQGAARMLLVFARLAEQAWLAGTLSVELEPHDEHTLITASLEDAHGRRALHPPFDVEAPLDEFVRALERRAPDLASLEVVRYAADGLALRGRLEAEDNETVRPGGDDNEVNGSEMPNSKRHPPPLPARGPRSARGDMSAKPTMKIPLVRLPPEAFRDDQGAPPKSRIYDLAAEETVEKRSDSAPPPTVRGTAGGPGGMDDIDDGWD